MSFCKPIYVFYLILLGSIAFQTNAENLKPISITDTAIKSSNSVKPNTVETDVTTLMEKIPGGGIHSNGAISGQTYYRGIFGPRMNVLIDDTRIESGGPNWMDPPLHYMPNTLVDTFEVERGIDSVSNGSTLGNTVKVTPKSSEFSDSDSFTLQSDIEVSAHSVDSGYNAGGIVGIANDQHRFHITGSHDDGDDFRAGDGDVDGTEYERSSVGAGYGVQLNDNHELSFDARYVSSKDSGTPSLPLDPNFFHTELYNFEYLGNINNFTVELDVFHTDIEHQMRNFELRPAPDFSSLPLPPFVGTDRRVVNVDADDSGAKLKLTRSLSNGAISFGIDGHNADHDAVILDPDVAPFFVTNFNNAEEDHLGFFTEWKGSYKQATVELGFRYKQVETDAGEVDAQPANLPAASMMGTPPAAVRALRDRFNNSDRSQEDDLIDIAAKLSYPINSELSLIAGYARKTRAPSYIERYLWIPLNVNAGLGDGNNYIGNVDLNPEWSNQFELGLDWENDQAYFNPRIHYQRINNFIQGVAVEANTFNTPIIGVSGGANGDATPLQFANVEAEIYGFDTDWGYQLNQHWALSGQASYVRGKRRDINDNLFHIAPPRASAALTRNFGNGSATIEGVVVAKQTKISDELTDDPANPNNNNDSTPGYGLINLYGQYTPVSMSNLTIQAGVENLLDKNYTDHLNGFNRVEGNGVELGERLPGSGINAFITVGISF